MLTSYTVSLIDDDCCFNRCLPHLSWSLLLSLSLSLLFVRTYVIYMHSEIQGNWGNSALEKHSIIIIYIYMPAFLSCNSENLSKSKT